MTPRVQGAIGVALLLVVAAAAAYIFRDVLYGEELAGKSGWLTQQQVEYGDRGNLARGPLVHRRGELVLLGIPGIGAPAPASPPASSRAWVILNEHARGRTVKLINAYPRYDLDCSFVEGLRGRVQDIDDYVVEHLRRICRRS